MADLPDSTIKINDIEVAQDATITEQLWRKVGGAINYLLDFGFQFEEYTTVGSHSFIVPATVRFVFVSGCGGGGGGAGAYPASSDGSGGSGGNAASYYQGLYLPVTPGDTIGITVADGGLGGDTSSTPASGGSDGGDTIVLLNGSNVFRFKGGKGAGPTNFPVGVGAWRGIPVQGPRLSTLSDSDFVGSAFMATPYYFPQRLGGLGALGAAGNPRGQNGAAGESSQLFAGGLGGVSPTPGFANHGGGGGAASAIGKGQDASLISHGTPPATPVGFGGGGAGGFGASDGNPAQSGGKGGIGYCRIDWQGLD